MSHLATFENWLRCHKLDWQHTPEEEATLRGLYEREKKAAAAHDPTALFRSLGQNRTAETFLQSCHVFRGRTTRTFWRTIC